MADAGKQEHKTLNKFSGTKICLLDRLKDCANRQETSHQTHTTVIILP